MSPIYAMLGAEGKNLPYLWLRVLITGLLVQPLIGALSDRTRLALGASYALLPDRRDPGSIGLLLMPFSPYLWFAAGLLWILDAGQQRHDGAVSGLCQ